MSARFR